MAEKTIAIVAFGMDHCMRGVEANAQMLFDKLEEEERFDAFLIKGSGAKDDHQVVLRVPQRDSLLCRILGRLRGYNIYWEQVFFMCRLGLHLLGRGRRYDVIYTQEYVHLIGMGKLKKWFGLDFDLIYCEGFVISRPTRLKYADALQEINRKNYEELRPAAESKGIDITLLPHFYEPEDGVLTTEELTSVEEVKVFKADRRMLFFVGSTERPEKNFDLLLDQFSRLTGDYCLLLCGECPAATVLHLREAFPGRTFHLYVRHLLMQELYPLADFFILPALNEPFGISIIEAMYFSRPLILHDTSHSRWVSGDAEQCIDMEQEGSLRTHLEKVEEMDSYIGDKGKLNRAMFDRNYTWSVLRKKYMELFDR